MKKLFAGLFLLFSLFSCDDDACPDGMEECRAKNGSKICVPKGNC